MQDLLNVGGSGVMAHQRLLVTTGNNVSNVNSKGYSMQRTEYQPEVTGGVGRGRTERVIDQFAQAAVWRNTSEHDQQQSYVNSVDEIDRFLSDDSLSLGPSIDKTFENIHAMNDTPMSTSTRALTLDRFQALTRRFRLLSSQFEHQQKNINGDLKEKVSSANKLIVGIRKMNEQIMSFNEAPDKGGLDTLKDKRDEAIHQLSKLIKINSIEQPSGARLVFMGNGHALVTEKSSASLDLRPGNPDPMKFDVYLDWHTTEARLDPGKIGGSIDGILNYREQIFEPSKNKLGQVALSMADAFNRQNHLGMDLEGKLGGDIFSLPRVRAMDFKENQGSGEVFATVRQGEAQELTPYDYHIRFTGGNSFTIQRYDGEQSVGEAIAGTTSNDYQIDGMSLDFSSGSFSSGDKFLLRPTKDAAEQVSLTMTQPEKLALAAPVRVDSQLDNTSNAKIVLSSVTDTDPATSGFTQPGGLMIHSPQRIEVTADGGYDIYDEDGHRVGQLAATDDGRNILSRANLSPGYDVSIEGQPKPGDVFTISYNTDGYADNFNGLQLADLQQKSLVRKGLTTAGGDDKMTFNDAYNNLVSFVGGTAAESHLDLDAAKSLLTQSEDWQNSVSGVNMDEEASNMIRFQQAYAASAQVIGTAQRTFETLLNAVR
ncbi:flagellar hook-associated protein FlgK [Celerinatantimonas sp. YJH-8]|uniref:flagellar hook-associated protein FlgK n=1 Tax=Celerinatantimonas sp. YJH-8 TaxID=3228714 RepID=UPI0038C342DA